MPCPFGHSERREAASFQVRPLSKKFRIERIGAGITALYVVDAETIEHGRDMALVGQRKIDAHHLRAIAQGRVKQSEFFARHWRPSCVDFGASTFFIRVLPSHWPSISIVWRRSARSPRASHTCF